MIAGAARRAPCCRSGSGARRRTSPSQAHRPVAPRRPVGGARRARRAGPAPRARRRRTARAALPSRASGRAASCRRRRTPRSPRARPRASARRRGREAAPDGARLAAGRVVVHWHRRRRFFYTRSFRRRRSATHEDHRHRRPRRRHRQPVLGALLPLSRRGQRHADGAARSRCASALSAAWSRSWCCRTGWAGSRRRACAEASPPRAAQPRIGIAKGIAPQVAGRAAPPRAASPRRGACVTASRPARTAAARPRRRSASTTRPPRTRSGGRREVALAARATSITVSMIAPIVTCNAVEAGQHEERRAVDAGRRASG